MAWVLPGNSIIEVSIRGTHLSQQVMQVLHYKYNTNVNAADGAEVMGQIANTLDGAGGLTTVLAAMCSSELTLQWLGVQAIYPTRFRRYDFAPLAAIGADLGAAATANVSAAITKYADEASRHGIGTTHIFAIPQTKYDEGYFVAGYQALLSDYAELLKEEHDDPPLLPVLFNRLNPAASLPITQAFAQNTVRVQRRRTVGVGK